MRNSARILAVSAFVLAGLAALGWGVAWAQAGTPKEIDPGPVAALSTGVAPTPDEISKKSEEVLARIEMHSMTLHRMIDRADQVGDVVQLDCLNDKLNIIDTRLRSSRERKATLDGALATHDLHQATLYLQVMQGNLAESSKARSQAEACVGSAPEKLSGTAGTLIIDPQIPDDPGQPPTILTPPISVFDLPPLRDPDCASCDL